MARIRSIKPDFFRHERLQDMEAAHPGQHVMLVFAALWGHCDKAGRFPWRPRMLKLDILPFLDFDLSASLVLLREAGLLKQYETEGELYGEIPTFNEHQRISGKEAQEPPKYPEPKEYITETQTGTRGEAAEKHPGRQEGKGREGEGKEDSVTDVTDADGVVKAGSDEHGRLLFRLARKAGRPSAPTEFRKLGLEDLRIEMLLREALGRAEPRAYLAGILTKQQRDGPRHWNDHGTETGMSPTLERLTLHEQRTEDRDSDAGTALLAASAGNA